MSHFPTFTKRAILNLTALDSRSRTARQRSMLQQQGEPDIPTGPRRTDAGGKDSTKLNSEIASLRREAEEPRSTERQESAQRVGQTEPATSRPARTPEVTITGQAATQPGICGRSPEIQRKILSSLKTSLCQVITTPELFRITGISDLKMDSVRAGDFQGLVNVTKLELTAKDIKPGAFSGMENLKGMGLTLYTYGSIAPGALQGLNSLETLTIDTSKPYPEPEDTLTLPDFDHLSKLHTLYLDGKFGAQILLERAPKSFLKNLPALEYLEMKIRGYELSSDTEGGNMLRLNEEFFENNKALKVLKITSDGQNPKMHIAEGTFGSTPLLREVHIGNVDMLKIPRNTFQKLEKLEKLKISQLRKGENEITLSETSPLYNKIVYGNESLSGLTLAD